MTRTLTPGHLPALGDVRAMGQGDTIAVSPSVRKDPQWSRYVEAIGAAVSKGCGVEWRGDDA